MLVVSSLWLITNKFRKCDFCQISEENEANMATDCAQATPTDPHPGISLSRLMLLKLQFLGRDAAGSNGHVQMANDDQIVHLKPLACRLRHADTIMNPCAIVRTHLPNAEVECLHTWSTADILGLLQVLILLSASEGQRGQVPSSSEGWPNI